MTRDRFTPTFQDKKVAAMADRLDVIMPVFGPEEGALATTSEWLGR